MNTDNLTAEQKAQLERHKAAGANSLVLHGIAARMMRKNFAESHGDTPAPPIRGFDGPEPDTRTIKY